MNPREAASLSSDVVRICQCISNCGIGRKQLADDIKGFAVTLDPLIRGNSRHLEDQCAELRSLLLSVSAAISQIADSEIRCSDDLRDIVERYTVITRIASEHQEALKNVDDLTRQLQKNSDERKKGAGNMPDLEQRFVSLRNQKKEALEQARNKTAELIEANKKYQALKVRRMVHAWTQFSAIMREKYAEVSELFKKFKLVLEGLRDRE
jgi:DNA repair ATPase RecN